MNTSEAGIELIKRFEGLRLKSYKPHPDDVWTIGYGHTSGVQAGDKVTKAEAERLLEDDLVWCEAAVSQHVGVPLNQDQFDALVSFTFNVGEQALKTSTLRRELNKGHYQKVDHQLSRWVYSGGKRFDGLVRRRKAEADLFTDYAPRFEARGAMPQTVEAEPGATVAQTVKRSRTAQSGAGVAGVGGLDVLGKLSSASSQVGSIQSNLGNVLEPTLLIPVVLVGVGGYIVYRKWSDVRNGRAY